MSDDTIIRTSKSGELPFTRIDNRLLNDSQLTFGARGLMCFLLSKPNGWIVIKEHLNNSSPARSTAINRMLSELKETGYVSQK
jgi:hypothetical protein